MTTKASSRPTRESTNIPAEKSAQTLLETSARTGMQADELQKAVSDHLRYSLGRMPAIATPHEYYHALALADASEFPH